MAGLLAETCWCEDITIKTHQKIKQHLLVLNTFNILINTPNTEHIEMF